MRAPHVLLVFVVLGLGYGALTHADGRGWISLHGPEHDFSRGQALMREGRIAEGLAAFQRALAKDPDHVPVLFSQALMRLRQGDPAGAREQAQAALAAMHRKRQAGGPGSASLQEQERLLFRILGLQAQLAMQDAEFAVAERALQEVLRRDPEPGIERSWASFRLAQLALAKGEYATAGSLLDSQLALFPHAVYRAVLHQARGRAALGLGDAAAALAEFSAAIETSARGASTSRLLDRGVQAMGFELGGSAFDDTFGAEAILRAGFDARVARGRLLLAQDALAPALDDLDAALRQAPGNAALKQERDAVAARLGLPAGE